jgi:hypothetical protein
VSGNKPLPASVRHDIVERTDGIPLFVEEMTKAVLEMVSEANAQQIAASVPPSTLAVPASGDCSRSTRGVHQKATKGRPPTSTGPDARPRPAAHTIVVACVLP